VLDELQRGHRSGACSAAAPCCPAACPCWGDDVADVVDRCGCCCADEREEVDVGDGLEETTGCKSMGSDVGFPSFTLFRWSMAAPPSSSWIMVMTGGETSSATTAQKAS
jgi:hypothetical protein